MSGAQVGALYRLQPDDAQARLVDNIATGLAQVSKDDVVVRSISYFRNADPDYGARVERSVKEKKG